MRFRSILLLGVSSVALQHADAQTAGVNGVPGSNVILPKYIPYNRPAYIVGGTGDRPYVSTPTVIYAPPTYSQLPLVTNGIPGYNTPFATVPSIVNGAPATPFGTNAPVVGQSRTDFAAQPSSIQSTFQPNFQSSLPPVAPPAIAPGVPFGGGVPIAPSAPPVAPIAPMPPATK